MLRDLGRYDLGRLRLRPVHGNLALLRPASQSSLSPNSRKPANRQVDRLAIDAGGAVAGVLTGHFGFQTAIEDRPWWQVDLGSAQVIGQVRLFNSTERPRSARALSVLVSSDGESWHEVHRKADARIFSGPDDPYLARLDRPVSARHVRIRQNVPGSLHLDEVEVLAP